MVADQLQAVFDAMRAKADTFTLCGVAYPLHPAGMLVGVTMNPGYEGRTELPSSLMRLMRPCVVMVPDFAMILEIILMGFGFLSAKPLSRKMNRLFDLCKTMLSKARHYDWGLRKLNSITAAAGNLLRAAGGESLADEADHIINALRDALTTKLTGADASAFDGLLGDLFGADAVARLQPARDAELTQAVEAACAEEDAQRWPPRLVASAALVQSVLNLATMIELRHSVMLLGPSGTNKTLAWRTLAKARGKVVWRDVNPKAVSCQELFGFIDLETREWNDGVRNNRASPKRAHVSTTLFTPLAGADPNLPRPRQHVRRAPQVAGTRWRPRCLVGGEP